MSTLVDSGAARPELGNPPGGASPPSAQDEGARYHHLDAVRGFALLLGVVFHAAESFGPRNTYWAVVDCSPSQLLEDLRFACHSFRLELFFVIAGFFARLLLMRRGTTGFMWNRTQRILVPLVVGWVLLYPLIVLIWVWGWSLSGGLAQAGIPPEVRNLAPWKLTLGFFLKGEFIQKFDMTHLWFLHQLLVVYVLVLGLRWVAGRFHSKEAWMVRCDRWFARVLAWPGAFLCFALPAIPMMLFMHDWVVDTPKSSLLPHLPTTLLFGFCFLAGWLWHRQPDLFAGLARRWPWHMAAGVLAWFGFGFLDKWQAYHSLIQAHPLWAHWIFAALYTVMMWAFVFGFLGAFTRFCARVSPWRRYVADASYWIYIVHLPLVVALQVMLGRTPWPWPIKYPFICAVALTLTFLSYHYLVRSTFIGVQLNGRRYPREWPWEQKGS